MISMVVVIVESLALLFSVKVMDSVVSVSKLDSVASEYGLDVGDAEDLVRFFLWTWLAFKYRANRSDKWKLLSWAWTPFWKWEYWIKSNIRKSEMRTNPFKMRIYVFFNYLCLKIVKRINKRKLYFFIVEEFYNVY